MLPQKKNINLRSSNCWKCTEIVNLTIIVLFLYHFKYFTILSGGPFWFLGVGGGVPRTPLPTGLSDVLRHWWLNGSSQKYDRKKKIKRM